VPKQKKNKPMSKTEQEARIAQLQSHLAKYDGGNHATSASRKFSSLFVPKDEFANNSLAVADDDEGSDDDEEDDDDSGSESEEE
jgi:hypothetical protein